MSSLDLLWLALRCLALALTIAAVLYGAVFAVWLFDQADGDL